MKKTILLISMSVMGYCMSAQSLSDKDKKFVNEATQAGMMEVKLGQIAEKSSNADVKMLGQHMVMDHTKAGDELKGLASKKGMTVATSLNKDMQMHYDEMSKKTGADFDKAYADMMVKDHKKVIEMFKTEAASGDDADLKAWAKSTLPTLEHHLKMSEDTKEKVK